MLAIRIFEILVHELGLIFISLLDHFVAYIFVEFNQDHNICIVLIGVLDCLVIWIFIEDELDVYVIVTCMAVVIWTFLDEDLSHKTYVVHTCLLNIMLMGDYEIYVVLTWLLNGCIIWIIVDDGRTHEVCVSICLLNTFACWIAWLFDGFFCFNVVVDLRANLREGGGDDEDINRDIKLEGGDALNEIPLTEKDLIKSNITTSITIFKHGQSGLGPTNTTEHSYFGQGPSITIQGPTKWPFRPKLNITIQEDLKDPLDPP